MLAKLSYRRIVQLCGEHELKRSGKKTELIKLLVENVPEEELRKYIMESRGIAKSLVEHKWAPKHRKLEDKETEELLKQKGITKWQLPKIVESDPMVMLVGGRPGDVLEITRASETAGTAKYYRVVIRANQ